MIVNSFNKNLITKLLTVNTCAQITDSTTYVVIYTALGLAWESWLGQV